MFNLTDAGHVVGMLDRDQRTAKLSVNLYRDRRNHHSSFISSSSTYDCQNFTSTSPYRLHNIPESCQHRTRSISHTAAIRGRTSPSSFRIRKHDNRHSWVSISRLHRTLILGFYLSIVTFPPTTLAAPSTKRSATMTSNGLEKWMIPCGKQVDSDASSSSVDADNMLNPIIEQSKIALGKANEFKEEFAQKYFKINWKELHEFQGKHPPYDWLPSYDQIPKQLGDSVDGRHLSSLELDTTLYNTYEYLQRITVGLDQIVIDEKNRGGSSSFQMLEDYALTVLCEIQTTMSVRRLPKKADIQRNILPDNLKNGDNTNMNVRNYMILRDYINILEYVKECFEQLKTKV